MSFHDSLPSLPPPPPPDDPPGYFLVGGSPPPPDPLMTPLRRSGLGEDGFRPAPKWSWWLFIGVWIALAAVGVIALILIAR